MTRPPLLLLAPLLATLAACGADEPPAEPAGPRTPPARGERLDRAGTPPSPGEGAVAVPAAGDAAGDGPRTITFGDLSLVGADIEGLLDAMFEDVAQPEFEYPPDVAALDGLEVELVGYMIALDYREDGSVSEFMLVRDLAACCFGGMPRPDEWVHVEMAEDAGSDLFMMVPFVVRGTLTVGLQREEGGFLSSAYQLRGTATRPR